MHDLNVKVVDVVAQVYFIPFIICTLNASTVVCRAICQNYILRVTEIAQARPVLHTSLMQRMTDVLSRMLNDPATRAALCGGGEDSLEGVIDHQDNAQNSNDNVAESSEERNNEAESVPSQSNQEPGTQLYHIRNRSIYYLGLS